MTYSFCSPHKFEIHFLWLSGKNFQLHLTKICISHTYIHMLCRGYLLIRNIFFELGNLLSRLHKRNCRQRTLTQHALCINPLYDVFRGFKSGTLVENGLRNIISISYYVMNVQFLKVDWCRYENLRISSSPHKKVSHLHTQNIWNVCWQTCRNNRIC